MKILFVHLCAPYNVGWTYRENLLPKYLNNVDNEVIVVTTKTISNLEDGRLEYNKDLNESNENGVKIIRLDYLRLPLPFGLKNRIRTYRGLCKVLDAHKPDLIYINGLQFVDLIKIIWFKSRQKNNLRLFGELNATIQNSARSFSSKYLLHKVIYSLVIKYSTRHLDKLYFGSEAAYIFSREYYGLKNAVLNLSPLGVDETKILQTLNKLDKDLSRIKYGIDNDCFVVVTGGRLDLRKKVIELMDAATKLEPNIMLIVFGEVLDDIAQDFSQLLEKLNNVKFLGWLEDEGIYEVLSISDLALFPGTKSSLWEVATAIGLPVVAQSWPGLDYIDFNGNILFYDFRSSNEIYETLIAVINNPILLEKMRKNALENSMRNLSYKSIAETILLDFESMRINL
jgi:1,2-diacylglycerol 3-alpha-glucosyltransferase